MPLATPHTTSTCRWDDFGALQPLILVSYGLCYVAYSANCTDSDLALEIIMNNSDYGSEAEIGDYRSRHAIPFRTVLVVRQDKRKNTFSFFDLVDESSLWIKTIFEVLESFRSELRFIGG